MSFNQILLSDNSKRYVLSASQQQNFSIPDSINYYITKNVSSPTVYQKLIASCKYYFEKNSILCNHCLSYCFYDCSWECCVKIGKNSCAERNGSMCWPNRKKLNFISQKIWITNHFQILCGRDAVRQLELPKNIQFSLIKFHIVNQIISLSQIAIIGSTVKKAYFGNVTVIDDDQQEVSLAKIIENLPFIEEFEFEGRSNSISTTTVEELLKCPKFTTLKRFYVDNIFSEFDIIRFYDFLKENTTMDIHLTFNQGLSENFYRELKTVTEEILKLNNIWAPCLKIAAQPIWYLETPINMRHQEDAKLRSHECSLYQWKCIY